MTSQHGSNGDEWQAAVFHRRLSEQVDALMSQGLDVVAATDVVAEREDYPAEWIAGYRLVRALEQHGVTAPPEAEAA